MAENLAFTSSRPELGEHSKCKLRDEQSDNIKYAIVQSGTDNYAYVDQTGSHAQNSFFITQLGTIAGCTAMAALSVTKTAQAPVKRLLSMVLTASTITRS